MSDINDFWQTFFGSDISPFEEILMKNGAKVLAPEEPLYALFAMLVRVIHEGQGKNEKALLRFAPELVGRAKAIISCSAGIEHQLALLLHRTDEFNTVMERLSRQVNSPLFAIDRLHPLPQWLLRNVWPVATSLLTFFFCFGFVLASYIYR